MPHGRGLPPARARLGRHVDGLVDAYYGPQELSREVDGEPLSEPAALVEPGDALLGRAGRRLAARPGSRATHLRGRSRRRGALVLGRGRGLLRHPPRAGRHRCLRSGSRAARRVAPGRRAARRPLRGLARRGTSSRRTGRAGPARGAAELARAHGGVCSSCPTARSSSSRRCATSRGGRSTTTSATCAAASSSTSTSRRRRRRRRARRPRGLSRPPHRARGQGAAPDPRPGRLEESIQLVPTPLALVSEGIAETGPSIVLDGECRHAASRSCDGTASTTTASSGTRRSGGARAAAPARARRGADDPRGRRVGRRRPRRTCERWSALDPGAGGAARQVRRPTRPGART